MTNVLEKSDAETIYIPVTGKTVAIIFVAVATLISSDYLASWNDDDPNADNASTIAKLDKQLGNAFNEIDELETSIVQNEAAISAIIETDEDCAEHQKILEEKMDTCRTRYAGLASDVGNNRFLIERCLNITGQ